VAELEVRAPIFVIGTGRCGSTIFYEMLAKHPQVAFVSNLNSAFPRQRWLSAFNTAFGKLGLRLGVISPSEAYPLLNSIYPGFGRPCRTLNATDVLASVMKNMRRLFADYLRYQRKRRICYKYTGWSRIGFFNKIFPDALFIHMVRDGRAVANSMLNVSWWHGWQGPWNWRWGELPKQYRKEWEQSDYSFAVLAGIEWKMILDEIEESKKELEPGRFLEIRYEDFVADPLAIFEQVTDFAGLTFDKKFIKKIERYKLRNMNYKWEEELSESERLLLNRCLQAHLRKYGYVGCPRFLYQLQ